MCKKIFKKYYCIGNFYLILWMCIKKTYEWKDGWHWIKKEEKNKRGNKREPDIFHVCKSNWEWARKMGWNEIKSNLFFFFLLLYRIYRIIEEQEQEEKGAKVCMRKRERERVGVQKGKIYKNKKVEIFNN